MNSTTPFVVVLAAAASRVGQSTLAENLAVYLRGLVEDLPLGFISFDPAQDPAQTFALVGAENLPPETCFRAVDFELCLTLGQFGIEYAHTGTLASLSADVFRGSLRNGHFPGILIIDAGPLNAIAATILQTADLVLSPVRDASGLAPLAEIRRQLKVGGGNDQMLWLVPAMVGNPMAQAEALKFLRFAAEERGCQVLDDEFLLDNDLAQKTSGVGGSVLTRMPESHAHQLLLKMAQLVLAQYEQGPDTACRLHRIRADKVLPASSERIELLCPLCQGLAHEKLSHHCESLPHRRRWLVHASCMSNLLAQSLVEPFWQMEQVAVLRTGVEGSGLTPQLRLIVAEKNGTLLESLLFVPADDSGWQNLIRHATGRTLAEQQPALIIVYPPSSGDELFSSVGTRERTKLRKQLLMALAPEL